MPGVLRFNIRQKHANDVRRHEAGHGREVPSSLIHAERDIYGELSAGTLGDRSIPHTKLKEYMFRNVQITGTQDAHQTITFASLGTPVGGGSLPTFTSAPVVEVMAYTSGRHVFIEKDSITTTQFKAWVAPIGDPGSSFYCDLRIIEVGVVS